jgi:shikimate kinase
MELRPGPAALGRGSTFPSEDGSMTVIVLYGPKAAGKSQVAAALRKRGVAHVDADELVLDLLAQGAQPHPQLGWLSQVEAAVAEALAEHEAVSVEATGAWDSDWQLAEDFEAQGQQVLQVWVWAPLDVTLCRLATRGERRVAITMDEARSLWLASSDQASSRHFQLVLDTSQLEPHDLDHATAPLAALLGDERDRRRKDP